MPRKSTGNRPASQKRKVINGSGTTAPGSSGSTVIYSIGDNYRSFRSGSSLSSYHPGAKAVKRVGQSKQGLLIHPVKRDTLFIQGAGKFSNQKDTSGRDSPIKER